MADTEQYYGKYHYSIDSKRRVFIPVKFRNAFGGKMYIAQKHEQALSVYSENGWRALKERINALPQSAAAYVKQYLFPTSIDVEPDGNGRVTLSDDLAKYADLKDKVVIIGVDDHVEIWSEDNWSKKEAELLQLQNIGDYLAEVGIN